MKVLYLTTMYPIPNFPQQGIFCHEQVKALVREGVEVTVVVPAVVQVAVVVSVVSVCWQAGVSGSSSLPSEPEPFVVYVTSILAT